ncbi:unnamed protein product [Lactuca virosa]|uniref:Uncharacterized protein n=1 Tax=Lactuca virosa TaxID=75947 RepID=A0AAU9LL38_9ASTR|nr:unnamed protein product [Lactuca virosa]
MERLFHHIRPHKTLSKPSKNKGRRVNARSVGTVKYSPISGKMWIFLVVMTIANLGGAPVARENTRSTSIPPAQEESVSRTVSKTTERPLSQNMDSFPNSGDTEKQRDSIAPTPIELYHKLHFHPTKEWLNDETHIQYENILQMKEDECTKLVSAGISITPEMEYDIEKKAVKIVSAKHKTLLSRWEASSGPIMRKKDLHILSAAETAQSAATDEVALKSKVTALEEEVQENKDKVKQNEEKCETMLQFMILKFPDSQNILCPPDK